MKQPIKLLLVEDDEDDVMLAKEYLAQIDTFDFDVHWASNIDQARKRATNEMFDIYLVDYYLGGENGLAFVRFLHDSKILAPSIIMTGQANPNVDIDASRSGAADYLVKGELDASLLERSIRYALSQAKIIRELNEKERKYRSLFERSIDPILLATRSLVLTDVNDSFIKSFGYSPVEIKGMSLKSLFRDPEEFFHYEGTLSQSAQIKDYEVKLVSRDGVTRESLLNCVYIPHPSDELCCFQCIIHDLTMRKQAENDMIVAERLSLTGKLARTIAHEVRNPLTNLSLALDQLRRELPAGNDAGTLFADIIQRNSNRIEQLVGEMLKSSKPAALNLQLSSVAETLDETIKLAIDRIRLNKIKLDVRIDPDLPRILFDSEKIQLALLNIVINATEAMSNDGELRIHACQRGSVVTISFADNGKGIGKEDLGRLFDPFFTGKQGGMGLGLTSTKNILMSHSARIDVESELGVGTTFHVHFKLPE